MLEVHVLALDLAKRRVQLCGADRGGAVLFNRSVSRSKLQRAAALHRRDGSLRDEPLLGPDGDRLWARGSSDPADLRQAVREASEE